MTTRQAETRRKRRAEDAATVRKRGWEELTVPEELIPDARALKAKWDPTNGVWLGKPGTQATLDLIQDAAPDGQTHFVITTDCQFCERPACYRTHSYRQLGNPQWDVDAIKRCDFCWQITNPPSFVPLDRLPGESAADWLARCKAGMAERYAKRKVVIDKLRAEVDADRPAVTGAVTLAGAKAFEQAVLDWLKRSIDKAKATDLQPPVDILVVGSWPAVELWLS